MPRLHYIVAALAVLVLALMPVTGAGAATVTDGVFFDAARERELPYRLYSPPAASTPAPVVIFSHGLGGSIETAPYLGEALAANGYLAFFIQHKGSDKSVWAGEKSIAAIKRKLKRSTGDLRSARNRFLDIPFVIDELERLNKAPGPLQGRMDLGKIGMAGHSYGARSVLLAAGEKVPLGGTIYKEPRIKAAIAMSPNVPERQAGKAAPDIDGLYSAITIPVFHMTGTEDGHPFQPDFDPATRTLPYRHITAEHQYLLVMDGVDHSVFSKARTSPETRARQETIARGAMLFFDAWLKGDKSALVSLQTEFPATLEAGDRFEYK